MTKLEAYQIGKEINDVRKGLQRSRFSFPDRVLAHGVLDILAVQLDKFFQRTVSGYIPAVFAGVSDSNIEVKNEEKKKTNRG